jgi:prophage regulatory protein
MEQHKPKKFMRRTAVEDATSLPTSTLYDKIAAGEFPKPVPLGPRSVAWVEDEVLAWQEAQIAKRDEKGAAESDRPPHRGKPCPVSPLRRTEQGWRAS